MESLVNTRNRDLTFQSTKTRRNKLLYDWLTETDHMKVMGRTFKSIPHRYVSAAYSVESTSPLPKEEQYKKLLHLGSYNYSGLNGHHLVLKASKEALEKYGVTTSGVRLLNGTTDLHVEFEKKLANFLGVEDVLTYSSGFSANVSVISALCSEKDVILSDELNHQSIIDGIKLSGAKYIKYKHRDSDSLKGALEGLPYVQRKFIITDGIFSMDGDVAKLDELVLLAEKYNAFIIVDDAHATAAFGPYGRGTPSHFKVEKEIDILTGSLSKGLPGVGGFAAGSKETIDILRWGSNGYMFSASLPPSVIGGLIAAIDILEKNPNIQEKLHENEKYLRDGIQQIGLNVLHSESPIIPIILPDRNTTLRFADLLHQEGVYVNPVFFPAVSRKLPRLRLNTSAALEKSDLNYTLNAIEKVALSILK
ncbi:aminotransferase class I/II-fold pyridoxal phosphate-dependent enzyme [Bacillus subtilis]|uniref:aminotransferase class I/II-fold pyridoxal phosphate-dependent enzyme n=1 Tax=Bacillus subtilis TaxID=1423 RepID=UPI0024C0F822|nr:aminotransferase class I/II-fold pyridoxal phosphate-dependent enzyme [Bacillus subtilis]WHY08799.1 aminotransferase class I/II-fold pyridoxal phosphate-dependent enzyme [Bacillus subtilis]WPP24854.1 aminotransferase class I/II-fold pyridoxal phosphate-dependent enzyme [Bacillus subtilis]